MYRAGRKAADLGIEEAAFGLHIAPRTLSKYESGDTVPPPEIVLAMSHMYNAPWLTQNFCRQNCAIGQAYSYEILNNVAMDIPSIMLKLVGEMREVQDCLGRMLELTVNKNRREDFTPEEWSEYIAHVLEFFDIEHNIEILKISLGRWCNVSELIAAHNQKCWEKGYVEKEKTASKAVR